MPQPNVLDGVRLRGKSYAGPGFPGVGALTTGMAGLAFSTVTPPCSKLTKKGTACPFPGDRCRNGVAYCHVHDPLGTYQRQLRRELEPRKKTQVTTTPPGNRAENALPFMLAVTVVNPGNGEPAPF